MTFINTLNVYNLYKVCVLFLCKLHKALQSNTCLLRSCLIRTYVLFAPLTQELAKTNSFLYPYKVSGLSLQYFITLKYHSATVQDFTVLKRYTGTLHRVKALQECSVINICAFLHIKNTEHVFYTQIRRATTPRAPSNYVYYCYALCIIIIVCYYVLYVIMCCVILLLLLLMCCCYVSLSIVVCC